MNFPSQVRDWFSMFEPNRTGSGLGKGSFNRLQGISEHRDFYLTRDDTWKDGHETVALYTKEFMSTDGFTYQGIFTSRQMAERCTSEQWGHSRDPGRYEPFPVSYKFPPKEKRKRVRASLDYAEKSHTDDEMRDGRALVRTPSPVHVFAWLSVAPHEFNHDHHCFFIR